LVGLELQHSEFCKLGFDSRIVDLGRIELGVYPSAETHLLHRVYVARPRAKRKAIERMDDLPLLGHLNRWLGRRLVWRSLRQGGGGQAKHSREYDELAE